jgi:hypothetical protein
MGMMHFRVSSQEPADNVPQPGADRKTAPRTVRLLSASIDDLRIRAQRVFRASGGSDVEAMNASTDVYVHELARLQMVLNRQVVALQMIGTFATEGWLREVAQLAIDPDVTPAGHDPDPGADEEDRSELLDWTSAEDSR